MGDAKAMAEKARIVLSGPVFSHSENETDTELEMKPRSGSVGGSGRRSRRTNSESRCVVFTLFGWDLPHLYQWFDV